MTGKVFADSANIYQDQAQILFDYYKKAAEKIVTEENEINNKITEAETATREASNKQRMSIVYGVGAVIGIIAGILLTFLANKGFIVLAIAGLICIGYAIYNNVNCKKIIEENQKKIVEFKQAYEGIRRDYKVSKIGVAYVPIASRNPSGDKSFLLDHTGNVQDMNFSLSVMRNPKEFKDAVDALKDRMDTIPTVESNESPEKIDTSDYSTSVQNVILHDYVGDIDRQVRNILYLIKDSDNISVDLPVIMPGSKEFQFINEYSTADTAGKPVVSVFDMDQYDSKLERFDSLGKLNHTIAEDGKTDTEYLKSVMKQLAQSVQFLTKSKTASESKLIDYSSSILAMVLKSAYNQYSPQLEAEEIERIRNSSFSYDEMNTYVPFNLKEGSRVRFDLFGNVWVAENGSRTSMPFGMNQIDEEVLTPVINNLMQENRIERLKIYNNIRDQKTDYLNQWHRDVEDFYGRNRTEANGLIQQMNQTYAEYSEAYTNYQQQKETLETMKTSGNINDSEVLEAENYAEVLAGFEAVAKQCRDKQESFTEFMNRIHDDIDESSEKFGYIQYYEASLRDTENKKTAMALSDIHKLDPRHQRLATVSPYLAKYAELPPEPRTSDELMDDFNIDVYKQAEESITELNNYEKTEAAG